MFSAFFLSAWIFFATSLGPPTTSHLDGAWSYLTSDFCCCEINWELWSVISPRKKTPGIRWRRTCCLDIYFLYIIVIHDVMPLEESVIQEFSHIIPHPYLWWRWPRFLCARRRLFPLGITFGNQFQPLLHSSESLLFKQKKYRRKLGQNLVKTLEVMGWKTTKKTPQKKSMKKNSFSGNKFGGWESCIPEASPHLKAATLRWLVTLVVNSLCVCVLPSLKTNRFSAFETMMLEKWQCSLPKADFFGCFFVGFGSSGLFAVCSFCRVWVDVWDKINSRSEGSTRTCCSSQRGYPWLKRITGVIILPSQTMHWVGGLGF